MQANYSLTSLDALVRSLETGRAWWLPQSGPQLTAYLSDADVIGYGGAAGGGKTDLAIGKALTQHRKAIVFRRNGTELTAVRDRLLDILGTDDGYSGRDGIWRPPAVKGLQIEFGSVPNLGDENKYRGRPHDLKVFEEATEMLEAQVRFLLTWLRSTVKGQRCQALLTFNPPTTSEGRWILEYFGPWLDDKHPAPAMPGELRWFAMIDGKELEVPSGEPFMHNGERIKPMSRTFIPSRVSDNQYLASTNYMATLQALPEPLRSQMLYGDFKAGMGDDPWQLCPTAWVDAAMARWKPRDQKPPMDSMGVDVARGGKDNTLLARRHANWYDEPLAYPGKETPDGPTVAGLVMVNLRDRAPIHIDVIGVGASPYDFLRSNGMQIIGVQVSEKAVAHDRSGLLKFSNLRSQLYWQFREHLDPANNEAPALPPDPRLRADLLAVRWEARGKVIHVEDRDSLIKRIGRSADWASAYIMARMDTPRVADYTALRKGTHHDPTRGHDPYAGM
jgi:hypothetical protein